MTQNRMSTRISDQGNEQVPRVVTGEKNGPTVAHACRKRRLKWVLPQVGGWSTGLATLSL
jgi:hypothetical protein